MPAPSPIQTLESIGGSRRSQRPNLPEGDPQRLLEALMFAATIMSPSISSAAFRLVPRTPRVLSFLDESADIGRNLEVLRFLEGEGGFEDIFDDLKNSEPLSPSVLLNPLHGMGF